MKGKRQAAPLPASALDGLSLSHGKRARLQRLLYGRGPANGTFLVLPLDQGLEHGTSTFLPNPAASDPNYQFALAYEGNYSAIALGFGLADKYMQKYAGRVPLILKLNGKTNIASDAEAVSTCYASVEDAVKLGADAVGYTIYVGSPRMDDEMRQFRQVRQDCDRYGMPLIVWSYPRGAAIDAKGGRNTLWAQDYAARIALEMGADMVKLHEPEPNTDKVPEPHRSVKDKDAAARCKRVVVSAGKTMVLFSGGEKNDDDDAVVKKLKLYMDAGATGVMFGRNMWLRPFDHALELSRAAHKIMAKYPR